MPSPALAVLRFRGPGSDSRASTIAGQLETFRKNICTATASGKGAPDLWVFHACGDGDIVLLALTAAGSAALTEFWRIQWGDSPGNVSTSAPGKPLAYLCRTKGELPSSTPRTQPPLAIVTLCRQANGCSAPPAGVEGGEGTVLPGCAEQSCGCGSTPGSFVVELDASFSHCHVFPVQDKTSLDAVRRCVTTCRSTHGSQTFSLLVVSAGGGVPVEAPADLALDFLVELSVSVPPHSLRTFSSAALGRWHSLGRRDYRLLFKGKSPGWMLGMLNERSMAEALVTRRCWPLLADQESTPARSCYRLPPPFFLPAVCGGVDMGQVFAQAEESAIRLWALLPGLEPGDLPPRVLFVPDAVAYPTILVPEKKESAELRIPHGFWERRQDGNVSEVVEHELANVLVRNAAILFEDMTQKADAEVKRLLVVLLRSAEQPLRAYGGTAVDLRHEARRAQASSPMSPPDALRHAVISVFNRYREDLASADRTPEETAALAADRTVGGALLYSMATDLAPADFQAALCPEECSVTAAHRERVAPILSLFSADHSVKAVSGRGGVTQELLLSRLGEAVHAIWEAVADGLRGWWSEIDGGPRAQPGVPYCGPYQLAWEYFICGAVHLRHANWLSTDDPSRRLGEAIRLFITTAGVSASRQGLDVLATQKLVSLLDVVHAVPSWDEGFGQAGPIVNQQGQLDCELLAWLSAEGVEKRYPQLKREEVNAPFDALSDKLNWWEALDQLVGSFVCRAQGKGPVLGIRALLELRLEQACIRGLLFGLSEIVPAARTGDRQPSIAFNLGPFWFTPDGRDLARAMGLYSDIEALALAIRKLGCTPVCELTEGVLGEQLLPASQLSSLGLGGIDLALDDLFGPAGDDMRTFRIFREYGARVVKRKVAFEVISAWLDWYGVSGEDGSEEILDAIDVYCRHSTLWGSGNGTGTAQIHIVVEGLGDVARDARTTPVKLLESLQQRSASASARTLYAQLAPRRRLPDWNWEG